MRFLLSIFLLANISFAQDVTPPADAAPIVTAEGRGVQVYVCSQQKGTFSWSFQAPEATLFDTEHKRVGSHGAGPTWRWNDGSSVKGVVVRKQTSPDPGSIAWLLLSASPVGNVQGLLTPTTWIRRSATKGGDAPAGGCDQTHEGAVARVPYVATYTFYRTHR